MIEPKLSAADLEALLDDPERITKAVSLAREIEALLQGKEMLVIDYALILVSSAFLSIAPDGHVRRHLTEAHCETIKELSENFSKKRKAT